MVAASWDEAVSLVDNLRQHDTPIIQRMIAVRAHYNADVLTPTYDIPGEDSPGRSPAPLLIADAIDKNAMRAASVVPSISMQGRPTAGAQKRVMKRRKAIQGVWHASAMSEAMLGRSFRHLFAYATSSMIAVMKEGMDFPIIELRDPMTTYAEPKAAEDFTSPKYVAYVYGKSEAWIRHNFPETRYTLFDAMTKVVGQNDIWDVLEYIDGDQIMLGILGPRQPFLYSASHDYVEWRRQNRDKSMMLRRWNNWAGRVPGFVARRVTLDRIEASVMKLTGLVNEIGRLRTLEKIAAERGVFPDMVTFGDGVEAPFLVGGDWVDGRDSEINFLQNAKGFQVIRMDPSVVSRQVTDQMQGAYMQSSGLDPLSVGESRQSLRTGKALDSMAGFSLDPQIMEAQKTMARMLSVVNEGVLELWRNTPGVRSKKISMFSGRPGDTELIEIIPKRDIDEIANTVHYPLPGADINSIQVALGQAMQTNQMSVKTARASNPLISNEEFEERQIGVESMEGAMLAALLAQAQNPQDGATLVDIAEILDGYKKHGDIAKAVREADELARARQANAQPDPSQQVGGLDPSNPGAVAGGGGDTAAPFAGPTDRGNQLQKVLRNLNSSPTEANQIRTPVGA